jgi:hypothetical protein
MNFITLVIEPFIDLHFLMTERLMTTHDFPTDPKIDALIERFPRLFRGEQPLVWSDLPQGWAELTDRLFADIDRMLDDEAAQAFTVLQIKEKFGGLRVSWRFAETQTDGVEEVHPRALKDLIRHPAEPTALVSHIKARVQQAKDEADTTCQQCGPGPAKPGRSRPFSRSCRG